MSDTQPPTKWWQKSIVFAEAHPEWVIRVALFLAGVALGHFWWR